MSVAKRRARRGASQRVRTQCPSCYRMVEGPHSGFECPHCGRVIRLQSRSPDGNAVAVAVAGAAIGLAAGGPGGALIGALLGGLVGSAAKG